ncbi:pyridoxal-dependent decarboxylase [Hymenobacter sp. UYCo722]|uniref:pyridoxal phosphate-dependent decarboxylase family protein n=1 Tax=Hymenobacter sp. UYCo722 TaxID=3156335 RepID=UPI0033948608
MVLFGYGTNAIRWIATDAENKMDTAALQQAIADDLRGSKTPFMVVGTAGDVSTGAVDDLRAIAGICRQYDLWFHIDGAYGVPAAVVPAYRALFDGMAEADSIALDPHKWLYSPLEAGCTLVKNPKHLLDTFSSHAAYYNFDSTDGDIPAHNYYEFSLQNSRSFRALKVWLGLQQAGRDGYVQLISADIALARLLFEQAAAHPELKAISHSLSISTLRYVPSECRDGRPETATYLNALNEALLNELQRGGEVFLSNAVVRGSYCLRACVVNFRTTAQDIDAIIQIIVREGRETHLRLQQQPVSTAVA